MMDAPELIFTTNNDNSLIVVINSNIKPAFYRRDCGKSSLRDFTSCIN
jgi:hypothetical protein